MKRESKVAWQKDASWNQDVLQQLKSGGYVSHSELLNAVDDNDHVKYFDITQSQPLKKENYVIFQYGVFLQRSDGRIAVFERAVREQGQDRVAGTLCLTRGSCVLFGREPIFCLTDRPTLSEKSNVHLFSTPARESVSATPDFPGQGG
jgi:hypothetical protein